jgi:hypothetical protein
LGIIAGSAHLEYKKAWDIVENIGHMKVIEMVRKERENIS